MLCKNSNKADKKINYTDWDTSNKEPISKIHKGLWKLNGQKKKKKNTSITDESRHEQTCHLRGHTENTQQDVQYH